MHGRCILRTVPNLRAGRRLPGRRRPPGPGITANVLRGPRNPSPPVRRRAVWAPLARAAIVALGLLVGCRGGHDAPTFYRPPEADPYRQVATQIEYPDVRAPVCPEVADTPAPRSLSAAAPQAFHDLSLEQAVQLALAHSRVMRDLGATVLRAPGVVPTAYGPAQSESDPRYGVEAALSAFDTEFSTSAFFEKNDRALNNVFFGGGTRELVQDSYVFQSQFSKRAVTGSQFTLRHRTDYDGNNAPGNAFGSAWNVNFETEFRHPLLQGAGVDYNRIAGPGATPGVYNGVLIARLNTDISLADFEAGVRNLVSDVENAYWDLYFAFRDLEARRQARDAALETWRRIHSLYVTGRRGGEAEKEARAREQYYRFEEEVQNALAGVPLDGTRNYNGSSGGTFRSIGGVLVAERRLRLVCGLPLSSEELLRPVDAPVPARIVVDWNEVITESLARRVELRRQRWIVKRRELELVASRNFLKPGFDVVGRYRWRGFGDDLIGGSDARFGDAWGNLGAGDFQEWQLGMEYAMPIGFRQGHAAVRQAEWNLARDRAVLHEQERQVVHDLGTIVAEIDRAFVVLQTAAERRVAAEQQFAATQAAYDADQVPLELLLEAQRIRADAESRFERAQVEYALAQKNLHFEKGSLLEYNGVLLAEGPWPGKAYSEASRHGWLRRAPWGEMSYVLAGAPVVARTAMLPAPPLPAEGQPPTDEQISPPGQSSPATNDGAARGRPAPPGGSAPALRGIPRDAAPLDASAAPFLGPGPLEGVAPLDFTAPPSAP